jgi:aspartate-semialdehyde dehydrogenase
MDGKYKVGIIGATGMVGQRFITLLENHPWFEVTLVAASSRSSGKKYSEVVSGRWHMKSGVPSAVSELIVYNSSEIKKISDEVDFVFCAVDMPKEEIKKLEEDYARNETVVVSNNSAHRWTVDVPMIIPEINNEHMKVIEYQRKRLGTKNGFITVKPNCSVQSYVPAIHPLMEFEPYEIVVSTYQAISGAGKTFDSWPEMRDNVIPLIKGEEEKSEKEPLKIWGKINEGIIKNNDQIKITSQCIRVPVTDGHLATVFIKFKKKITKENIIEYWDKYKGFPIGSLPSAPQPFLNYFHDEDRPQTRIDRDLGNGMAISIGRLREDSIFDYKFVCLSHNTIRGAAGGAILIAELLSNEGYLVKK